MYLFLPLYIFSFSCILFLPPYKMFFSFLITRQKSSAKLLQNFELCKFFGKKIF